MVKGEDALRRKKNKVNRKRMRSSDSAVSARVASIIASKRRRQSGKRRHCEGMCFALPTADDPFLDNPNKKRPPPPKKKKKSKPKTKKKKLTPIPTPPPPQQPEAAQRDCLSKFVLHCLNTIQLAWDEEEEEECGADRPLLISHRWGVEFCRRFSDGLSIVDTDGTCASREQIAWLVSVAAGMVTSKEKLGLTLSYPVMVYLVPSQEKALRVRSVCKPLKDSVHTVSLHPGATLDHQVRGLKSAEPEFLVSTPERLLELVSLGAIDISGTSLLVVDGLKDFAESGFLDKVKSIREKISGDPQIVIFSDYFGDMYTTLVQNLLRGPTYRLSLHDSVVSQSAFISQSVHFYVSEEEKMPKAIKILREALHNQTPDRGLKVLFITKAARANMLAFNLKAEGFSVSEDCTSNGTHGSAWLKATIISVKDRDTVLMADVEEFEIVIFMEFPPSIEDYIGLLTKIARYSVTGVLHSFFCKTDNAHLAQSLINVLVQCHQTVPQTLQNFAST